MTTAAMVSWLSLLQASGENRIHETMSPLPWWLSPLVADDQPKLPAGTGERLAADKNLRR